MDAWLVCSTSQEPGVSRAFQITLPMGGNTPTQKVGFSVNLVTLTRKTRNWFDLVTKLWLGYYNHAVFESHRFVLVVVQCMYVHRTILHRKCCHIL